MLMYELMRVMSHNSKLQKWTNWFKCQDSLFYKTFSFFDKIENCLHKCKFKKKSTLSYLYKVEQFESKLGLFPKYQWDLVTSYAKWFSKWKDESSAKCSGTESTCFKVCAIMKVFMFAFSHQNTTVGHFLLVLYLMCHYSPSNFPV